MTLLDEGLVSLPDAVASVFEGTSVTGERILTLRLLDGLQVDVMPDRGLDLGAVWWCGTPVAWRSPNLVDPGPGRDWEARFLGGLLATCGPDNIGPPRGSSGQHGTHHLTPAHEVRWWRERTPTGIEVHVRGLVAHTSLGGPKIVVEREVVATTGRPAVEVRDIVRNVGDRPTAVPLLYHVNLGAPLLAPGGTLEVAADAPVLREPAPPGRHPLRMPEPSAGAEPVVAEHPDVVPDNGWARALLTGGPRADVRVEWSADTLPRLCTWSWPAAGAWVLGVEPTNAALFGPERELPDAGAPVLGPGEQWRTTVRVVVRARALDH